MALTHGECITGSIPQELNSEMKIGMLEVYCGVCLKCVQCFCRYLYHNKAFEKEKKTSVGEIKMQNEAEDKLQCKVYGNSPIQLGALKQGWPSRVVSDLGAGDHSLCPCINQTLGVSCPP